jgi:iron uptake system component EfeO
MAGFLVGCGDDDSEGAEGGTSVQVMLDEFSVATEPPSARSGEVTFDVSNDGEETHEIVVVRTDLGLLDLPTAEDGSVDEEGEGVEVVGEVEDIAAGASGSLTLDLETGQYVLICNIVEEEMEMDEMEMEHDPSHYQSGMRTEFTVE